MALKSVAVFILLLILPTLSKIILRIRLPTGAMKRIEIDDSTDTVEILYRKLISEGVITSDMKLEALGESIDSKDKRARKICELGIKNGEVIAVVQDEQHSETSSQEDPGRNNIGSNECINNHARTKKFARKKMASIGDIEKRRKELIKIKRQKTSKVRSVSVAPTWTRILKRVSPKGCALLLGKKIVLGTKETKVLVKTPAQSKEVINEADKVLDSIQIYASCEISSDFEKQLPSDLSTLPEAKHVVDLAKSLGLSVVGCCLGGGKGKVWGVSHVFASVQLRKLATDNAFITLSAFEEADAVDSPSQHSSGSTKSNQVIPKKKKLRDSSMGLALEAFQLSDQALQLIDKQILTSVPLPKQGQVDTIAEAKPSGTVVAGSRRMDSKAGPVNRLALKKQQKIDEQEKSAAVSQASEKVLLAGAVLLQSDEAVAVDSLLLAIPLPIVPLAFKPAGEISLAAKRKGGANPAAMAEVGILEFEHSFPSGVEMAADDSTAHQARVHLVRTLSEKLGPATKARFRDPHLLLYLKGLVDPRTFAALCRSVMDSRNPRFSSEVTIALDMLKMTLGSAGSRRRHFNDDDDDN